jgi:hypothetical protein
MTGARIFRNAILALWSFDFTVPRGIPAADAISS